MIINNVALYTVVRKFEICRTTVNVSSAHRISISKTLNTCGYVCAHVYTEILKHTCTYMDKECNARHGTRTETNTHTEKNI